VTAVEISHEAKELVRRIIAVPDPVWTLEHLHVVARDLGVPHKDDERAAQNVLDEMRRRGWKITLPVLRADALF
jgi:hypothetical protein